MSKQYIELAGYLQELRQVIKNHAPEEMFDVFYKAYRKELAEKREDLLPEELFALRKEERKIREGKLYLIIGKHMSLQKGWKDAEKKARNMLKPYAEKMKRARDVNPHLVIFGTTAQLPC
jgi:hypothetical protein